MFSQNLLTAALLVSFLAAAAGGGDQAIESADESQARQELSAW